MNDRSKHAVAEAVVKSRAAAETAVLRVYEALCAETSITTARQRRGLLGLGKHLAGNPNDLNRDHVDIYRMLGFIDNLRATSLDDRALTMCTALAKKP